MPQTSLIWAPFKSLKTICKIFIPPNDFTRQRGISQDLLNTLPFFPSSPGEPILIKRDQPFTSTPKSRAGKSNQQARFKNATSEVEFKKTPVADVCEADTLQRNLQLRARRKNAWRKEGGQRRSPDGLMTHTPKALHSCHAPAVSRTSGCNEQMLSALGKACAHFSAEFAPSLLPAGNATQREGLLLFKFSTAGNISTWLWLITT